MADEMTAPVPVGFSNLPGEIQDQIMRGIPVVDLSNVMLVSRTFHRQARPYLYESVHYIQREHRELQLPFMSTEHGAIWFGNFDFTKSARIVRPGKFIRMMEEDLSLRYRVSELSFSAYDSCDKEVMKDLMTCLELLRPQFLHLNLAYCQMKLALSNTVTSLDIKYPTERALATWQDTEPEENFLREEIYAIFTIPTLQQLTLRGARRWNAFSRILTYPQYAETSNIVALSLPDTVPMDVDLEEILTWPKALKWYFHQSLEGHRHHFQFGGGGHIASPEYFLKSLATQRDSLQELIYNHGEDCCGDDESLFDPVLMREFVSLKYLSVPRKCFVDAEGMPNPLYTALPPKLEKFKMDQDARLGNLEYEARLKYWLQDILDHKTTWFPSLKYIIIRESGFATKHADNFPGTTEVLERM